MYDTNNIFAKIIKGEIPADKVYEDDGVIAFKDISPAAPTHVLVIPKGEYVSLVDFTQKAGEKTVVDFFSKVIKVARDLGLEETGYRIITNHGNDANQTVKHFHAHILGGKPLGGLLADDSLKR